MSETRLYVYFITRTNRCVEVGNDLLQVGIEPGSYGMEDCYANHYTTQTHDK